MSHVFYSQRIGVNPNLNGLELQDVVELFVRVFNQFMSEGYFDEAFGFNYVDAGPITGNIKDVELDILLSVRKKYLWPIELYCKSYSEDDLLDIIEYL